MATHNLTLRIDFGAVGYDSSKERFCVTLDATPLADLIADANNAYRLHELFLIQRPGDVWDYVQVFPEALPRRIAEKVAAERAKTDPGDSWPHPWPADRLPLTVFDTFFSWQYDDTEPEASAWLEHRDALTMKQFADQLLGVVSDACHELRTWNDPLRQHVVKRIEQGRHAYAYLARAAAIHAARRPEPFNAGFTEGFYRQLGTLLAERDLVSVAFRGSGDWRTLRMIATAQRERARATGHECGLALHAGALTETKINNQAWESRIWLSDEGLGFGDLFIDTGGIGDGPKSAVEAGYRGSPRRVLCAADDGPIAGYELESGDGYAVYRLSEGYGYRRGMELIASRRPNSSWPVLKFASEAGKSIFPHENGVIVVGQGVDQAARTALAPAMARWQASNPRTLLLVQGDTSAFLQAGCRAARMPEDTEQARQWLQRTLSTDRLWIDVLLALDLPAWADEQLAKHLQRQRGPWDAFVVASGVTKHLVVNHVLEGDWASGFSA